MRHTLFKFNLKQTTSISAWQADDVDAEQQQLAGDESVSLDQAMASQRLAELNAAEQAKVEESDFALNFLWLDKNIAVSVDQVFAKGHRSPVTEYFFWPRKDAWEELKAALEARPWIGERSKVLLLNRCTEVINYWQDEDKHSIADAETKFTDCKFMGA